MISLRLKTIFLISIPFFIVHGLEEYYTGFYKIDSSFNFFFSYFNNMTIPQATFLLFEIMLWFMFVISAFLISGDKWRLRIMVIPALIYLFELHHFWKAFELWGYYPGVISALAFPIIGFLYWKELLKCFSRNLGAQQSE